MYRNAAISGIASNMLTWITIRSISVPWAKISLRISLSKTGLAPSASRSLRFFGANSQSGNWSLWNHQADCLAGFGFQVDNFFAFAAHVSRMEQPLTSGAKQHAAQDRAAHGQQCHGEQQPGLALASKGFHSATPNRANGRMIR